MRSMVKMDADGAHNTLSPSKSKANMVGWTTYNTGGVLQ